MNMRGVCVVLKPAGEATWCVSSGNAVYTRRDVAFKDVPHIETKQSAGYQRRALMRRLPRAERMMTWRYTPFLVVLKSRGVDPSADVDVDRCLIYE